LKEFSRDKEMDDGPEVVPKSQAVDKEQAGIRGGRINASKQAYQPYK
jgi:hypothetical protein